MKARLARSSKCSHRMIDTKRYHNHHGTRDGKLLRITFRIAASQSSKTFFISVSACWMRSAIRTEFCKVKKGHPFKEGAGPLVTFPEQIDTEFRISLTTNTHRVRRTSPAAHMEEEIASANKHVTYTITVRSDRTESSPWNTGPAHF